MKKKFSAPPRLRVKPKKEPGSRGDAETRSNSIERDL
jgi:hypothetical protein